MNVVWDCYNILYGSTEHVHVFWEKHHPARTFTLIYNAAITVFVSLSGGLYLVPCHYIPTYPHLVSLLLVKVEGGASVDGDDARIAVNDELILRPGRDPVEHLAVRTGGRVVVVRLDSHHRHT